MIEDTTTTLTVQHNDGADYADNLCYSEYGQKYNKQNSDQIFEDYSKVINIIKSSVAISKKEADTCAYISKKHTDMEVKYVESLLEEKERKDITPEEVTKIDERIEKSLLRMEVQEEESRTQLEKSPYRKTFDWTVRLLFLSTLCVGYAIVIKREIAQK